MKKLRPFVIPILAGVVAVTWINLATLNVTWASFYLLCGQPYVGFLFGYLACSILNIWRARRGLPKVIATVD